MYKKIIKLPVIAIFMTQVIFSATPEEDKKLDYATIAKIFDYQVATQKKTEGAVASAETASIDTALQFGVSQEALRFAIRTLTSVAITLKSQQSPEQNLNTLLKKDGACRDDNNFVHKVTNIILGIVRADENGELHNVLQAARAKLEYDPPSKSTSLVVKHHYFRVSSLAKLVAITYKEVQDKIAGSVSAAAPASAYVAHPVQREFHGDPNCVSVDSFDVNYTLPEAKHVAREALLQVSKQKIQTLNAYLKTKLIGQDDAIDEFTDGIFCHEKGLLIEDFLQQIKQVQGYDFFTSLYEERKPAVILLMGPSGTGKTAMFTLAMKFLKKPYGIGSGADMTKAGYVGGKPENAIEEMFEQAETMQQARDGAVLYDEICKLAGTTDEFTGAGQHGLLTIIEGTKTVMIERKTQLGSIEIPFNGRRVLYVLAGAFSDIIAHKKAENNANYITDEHLISFGLKRELVNRIRTIVSVKPFTESNILQILSFQDSPLKQVLTDLADKGVNVSFDRAALDAFAKFSVKEGFGARNLSRQLQEVIKVARESQQGVKVRLTADHVEEFQKIYHPPYIPHSMFL